MNRGTNQVNRQSSHPFEKRLMSAISLSSISSVLSLVASALAGIGIARNVGPEGYGTFVAGNLIVFVVSVFCSFGVPLAVAKLAAADEERKNYAAMRRRQTTALLLLLSITFVASLVTAWSVPRLAQHLNVRLGLGFSLALPAMLLCAVVSDYAQVLYTGLLRLRPVLLITLCGPMAVILFGILRRAGVLLPIWQAVAVLYLAAGIASVACLWRDKLLGKPGRLAELKPMANHLPPAAAFTFFSMFSVSVDRWIVGSQMGGAAIGAYAAAMLIIQAALRVPKNLAYVIVPTSMRILVSDDGDCGRFNNLTIQLFGLIALSTTVFLLLAPTTVLRTLFGFGFVAAAPALRIMAPVLILSVITIPVISTLTGSAHHRFVTYLLGGTLIPRILLLLLFTRWWGLPGTAAATLIGEVLLATICVFTARKLSMHFAWQSLQLPLVAAAVGYSCGLVFRMIGAPELVSAAIAIVIFVAGTWKRYISVLTAAKSAVTTHVPVTPEAPQ